MRHRSKEVLLSHDIFADRVGVALGQVGQPASVSPYPCTKFDTAGPPWNDTEEKIGDFQTGERELPGKVR